MKLLSETLRSIPEYQAISRCIQKGKLPVAAAGLSSVHKAHLIYTICEELGQKALVLVSDELEARHMQEDLAFFYQQSSDDGLSKICRFPARDFSFYHTESISRETEYDRLTVLGKLAFDDYKAVVMTAEAAMQFVMPLEDYQSRSFAIQPGSLFPTHQAAELLTHAGYRRTGQVEGKGQFSIRGGLIDFFPPHLAFPVRVELWGDEIDSINYFDVIAQRRTQPLSGVRITPARELLPGPSFLESFSAFLSGLKGKNSETAKKNLESDFLKYTETGVLPEGDKFFPLVYRQATIFDYFTGIPFLCEPTRCHDSAAAFSFQFHEDLEHLLAEGVLCRGMTDFIQSEEALLSYFSEGVILDTFARSGYHLPLKEYVNISARQLSVWGGSLQILKDDLDSALHEGFSCVILVGTQRAAAALCHDLNDAGISAFCGPEPKELLPGQVFVAPGRLSSGMEYRQSKFMLLTHGRPAEKLGTHRKSRYKSGDAVRSLSELRNGDHIVHVSHGIGIFEGVEKIETQGIIKDYIKIRYAGTDVLYVPITQLDLVSKYIGNADGQIRLNKMGGTDWQKTKTRVKRAVKDMAKELTLLYAKRAQLKGFAFSPDTEWQKDFEERFEYSETDDQLKCIAEIKNDMEQTVPMDRLLCGDVGFGKTEVALRGVFKCVNDGKQCAILVPTTILAWQHYQTVTKRMEGFPIRVEMLSRFRTPKQQEQIIRKLKTGEIDIIIGTHRLVQKDISFRSLGLLIIDEEQRLGVAQKEYLKEKYENVDCLTLSATPIPRTLNMALSGIRDMSSIEEAPQDRHPVQTYVLEQEWSVLTEAMRKELRRGGQVYYLHNRVETIERTAAKIQTLLPQARVQVVHGKMDEKSLTTVWEDLIAGNVDILVCTTIIETGVDVPNVNTLIIENADRMGLAQLHQIRGRVGRSNRRAFAYFTFQRGKVMTEIATKRLDAIREFTEFGSGFRIALRDLEIRGAGNLLGGEQHGHLEDVGYEMYVRLLSEAVREEKGEAAPDISYECSVDLQISAHIPETYISHPEQRIDIYRRIADIRSEQDSYDVVDELIDRFGEPPVSVRSLISIALLRNTAAGLGIREIVQRGENILIYPERFDLHAAGVLASKMKGRLLVNAGQKPYFSIRQAKGTLELLRSFLKEFAAAKAEVKGDAAQSPHQASPAYHNGSNR